MSVSLIVALGARYCVPFGARPLRHLVLQGLVDANVRDVVLRTKRAS